MSNMTLKTFAYDFRRGLGSAIIELKNNPEREKYRDIVMRYCLKDIAYDTQAEGTKGYYLYTAINCFDKHEDFLNAIIEKLSKKLSWRLSEQLFDILVCFSEAGNKIAKKTLEEKNNKSKSDDLNTKIVTLDTFCQCYTPEKDVPKKEKITIDQLIDYAKEIEKNNGKPFTIRMHAAKFIKQANKNELKKLGSIVLDESSDLVKAALLFTFNFTDFPLDVDLLFPYVFSNYRDLCYIAVETLSRITDKKINALVLQLFNEGQVENAIALLKSNFTPKEEALIRKHVKSNKNILHGIVMDIAKIFNKYRSETCVDILLKLYKNIECTHCRCSIVEAMIKNNVMPLDILEECRYDSYNETRKIYYRQKEHLSQ